jgi:hypothetical protein
MARLDPAVNVALGRLAQLEAKGHVVIDGHVGIEGVALEDHGDVPVFGSHVVDHPVANDDLALCDLLQAGQAAQGRGLAAAGGSDQDQEFFVGDLDVQVVDGHHIAESLGDMIIGYTSHTVTPFTFYRL